MRKLKDDRIDDSGCFIHVHNESNKLPGHEERMKAHCERIQKELKKKRKRRRRKR